MNPVLKNLKFEYVKHFNGHPCILLSYQLLQELIKTKFLIPQYYNLDYEAEAIVCTNERDEPIGYIAFTYQTWNRSYHICGAYVVEHLRGNGIHTKMFDTLIEHAKNREEKVINIVTQVSINNKESIKAMERQKRILTMHTYEYPLMDWMKS